MGSIWQLHEDELLKKTVLDYSKRGTTLNEAIESASKQLNRTIQACSTRWYENFQEMYKNEINRIKTVKARTNDYAGKWTAYDDEKLMKVMIHCLIQDVGKMQSLEACSKELGRSIKSVENRWYQYIMKRNKLTIENLVEEGKEKMAKKVVETPKTKWDEEEQYSLYKLVMSGREKGEKVGDILEEAASNQFKYTLKEFKNKWYNYIYKNQTFVKRYQSENTKAHTWTSQEDNIIVSIVLEYAKIGKSLVDAFKYSSELIDPKVSEIEARWKSKLQYENTTELRKIQEARKKGEVPVVEIPVVEIPVVEPIAKIEVIEQLVETKEALDTNKLDEFMNLVNKLITKNEQLERENKELVNANKLLSEKAIDAETITNNYQKVMDAMERARQFVLESETKLDEESIS